MRSAALVVPGSLNTRTGGYIYDRRIAEGLRECGWTVDVRELPNGFPLPDAAALEEANRGRTTIADGTVTLVDGLAFGAMPAVAQRHAARLRFVPIVHLPLAEDVGLDLDTASELARSEQQALAAARMVVVTGD